MKRIILICFVLISGKTFAQETRKTFFQDLGSRLSVGLTAGGSYTNFYNANFKTDYLAGYNGGVFVQLRMFDHLDVVEDFVYSQEGAKSNNSVFGNTDIKLSYINVPVVFRFKTNAGLFIEAGTQSGIKVKEDVDGVTNGDFAKKINIGLVGGLGFQGKKGLGIRARYVYGLTQVGNFEIPGVSSNFKSQGAQASLFYTF